MEMEKIQTQKLYCSNAKARVIISLICLITPFWEISKQEEWEVKLPRGDNSFISGD